MDPWKFEDNLQNVCFAGLTARGIPHGTTRGNVENAQDRVEVFAAGFQEASARMDRSSGGVWFRNHYSGTLAFGVDDALPGGIAQHRHQAAAFDARRHRRLHPG